MVAALHGASAALPHLSGLAHLVKVGADARVATAAVAASGRLLVNPTWFAGLAFAERVFVMAHELMHLALRSHERCAGSEARLFNVAHDLIINDMLSSALNMPVPANGLFRLGASSASAERLVVELKRDEAAGGARLLPAWHRAPGQGLGGLGAALVAAGLGTAPPTAAESDLLDAEAERKLFPGLTPDPLAATRIAAAGERSLALKVWQGRAASAFDAAASAVATSIGPELGSGLWEVLATYHAPPWEVALQHWLDEATPSGRTYRRCSRRQGDRTDVVLPGRAREGWTLNVILDTSGSMWGGEDSPIDRALGSLKSFCISANVGRVRIVQGGTDVEADEVVDARDLDLFRIAGGGGSDMAPSMRMLAVDPTVEAAIVITDGGIDYPAEPMPYAVLWALTEQPDPENFDPGYGRIVVLTRDAAGR